MKALGGGDSKEVAKEEQALLVAMDQDSVSEPPLITSENLMGLQDLFALSGLMKPLPQHVLDMTEVESAKSELGDGADAMDDQAILESLVKDQQEEMLEIMPEDLPVDNEAALTIVSMTIKPSGNTFW